MTIRDIAEMARVSKGTVSKVLNDAPGVGDDTRRRILKLIESLDFHPNATARGLAARRSNALGFVIPHTGRNTLSSTFWPSLLTVITEEANARGINVLLSTSSAEGDIDSAFRAILKGRRIDGAIIGAEQFGERQLAELLMKSLPFVMVGKSPHLSSHFVDVDHLRGSQMAAELLLDLGHRSIGMLAGPASLPYVQERIRGFGHVASQRGVEAPVVRHCAYVTEEATRVTRELLTEHPEVTALYLAAGDFVVGALAGCADAGRAVPRDISVLSFDDHPFFPHLTPPVTAVGQPLEEMGRAAVGMLFELMAGRKPDPATVVLPPRLAQRGSCAPPTLLVKTPR